MRRRGDYQLDIPIRTPDSSGDRGTECKQAQVSSRQILADVPLATQPLLSFTRVDHPVEECTSGGRVLSAQLEAQRRAALSSYQETVVASISGVGQDQLVGNLCLLPQEGA